MSHLLWKYYWENDVDKFRRLLAPTGPNAHSASKSPAIGSVPGSYLGGSPVGSGASPRLSNKSRRASGYPTGAAKPKDGSLSLGRAEVNSRDYVGLTILLRAASSTEPNSRDFVQALIEHPAIDLYAQDPESGWNALHRSLYAGNVSIARMLLEKERGDLTSHTLSSVSKVGLLIKTKDHEGNSPFDVYNSTVATRSLKQIDESGDSDSDSDSDESLRDATNISGVFSFGHPPRVDGDELFMFGSNKNLSLGVGDEDDRQYPDRILLRRPSQLLHRFHQSYLDINNMESSTSLPDIDDIPNLIRDRPLVIQDVVMSKLHTAVLTGDPMSNLYICGVGRGGRLGLGDENTRFKFAPVQGPLVDKKIRQIALGQNHSMAIAGNGELWTWGLNSDSQLGYALPPPMRADEEPMSVIPRQVFGPLKKETIMGVAASALHSVAHTGTSLYCWGRNVGQLALMDADSRSLDVQQTPRRVAASLLSAPIEMVSAIDKATTVLLTNYTVWVFTDYGYNLIKFPALAEVYANNLSVSSFSNRYDPGRKDIRYITSGGETIAAINARGDLFTMHLNHKGDASQPGGSTTNPVRIKGAVTQPQCIWDSRKDGVASVGVGEHGSVIICTKSGAVWRRVKRVKGKDAAFSGTSDARQKDFKFQRVPYINDCVAVRSSTFGACAAIRQDNKVMSEEITIAPQALWEDVASLMCLNEFRASELVAEDATTRKVWNMAIAREQPGTVPHEIMRSPNLEEDLSQWLRFNPSLYDNVDMEIRSSLAPEIKIPIHGWVLAGRSPTLRDALSEFRRRGYYSSTELFVLEKDDHKGVMTLQNVDLLTLLNLVVWSYQDSIIPVWQYTRAAPSEAYRYRQIRLEVMKMATHFGMTRLEVAARQQTIPEPSLDSDLHEAILDSRYFEDGDITIELDGAEINAHSQLICQRCPFFEGMFNGRSRGQWLTSRREGLPSSENIKVDLKHVTPVTFQYVLEFIYADVGEHMFDDVAMTTIDDFSELVLDVMGVANELMLDRLSQICQSIIGKFVTTRNVANLLNEISPCSVTEFKDTGLEYICLQLESMLENHLLDGLDEDLLLELDEVVRDNQLARFPFVRSGRAELLLHEKYPALAQDIDEERQRRVKAMAFKAAQRDEERKLSSSYKARFGSFDESSLSTQTPDRMRRKSRAGRNEPFSPNLRPQELHGDLIFDMEDEESAGTTSPLSPELTASKAHAEYDLDQMPRLPKGWREAMGKDIAGSPKAPLPSSPLPDSMSPGARLPHRGVPSSQSPHGGRPWASATLATNKLDLKDIMTEVSSTSNLTAKIAEQTRKDAANKPQSKLSQKERKKQMQMQAEAQAAVQDEQASKTPWEKVTSGAKVPPWKVASPVPKLSLQEAMSTEAIQKGAISASAKPLVAVEASPLSTPRRTASPDTRFSGQKQMSSSPATASTSQPQPQPKKPVVPHSRSYMKPAAKSEPSLALSMADIIGQQEREQELVKEAVAKRSLQEIQQEQAFQEWWDQESRRAQDDEAKRQARGREKDDKEGKRGRRGRGGRGGKAKTGEGADSAGGAGERSSGGSSRGGGATKARGGKGRGGKS